MHFSAESYISLLASVPAELWTIPRIWKASCLSRGVHGLQAGGKGSTGTERVLDVCPEKVHQRVPLFIGSRKEVEYAESFIQRESS